MFWSLLATLPRLGAAIIVLAPAPHLWKEGTRMRTNFGTRLPLLMAAIARTILVDCS